MASTSSYRSRRYDVFPSFSGEDVRKSFLSHLLKELDRKSINTFIDHGIERSRPIGPELLSAIRESRISIIVFSNKYASSSWCLNELVEIHKCFKDLDQMVIPIFYEVDPSHVRKQTGEFGEAFMETCKGKADGEKKRWMQALADVANVAGEDSRNWCDEAKMIETIANDVSNKLITPSSDFGDFIGVEAHLEAMNSKLCLESEESRMVGIVGPSGIGKSTIGRALFTQLFSQFHYRAFVAYTRTNRDDYGMKLYWEEQFLSEILCQKDIKVLHLGSVEQRLKHKKVLIVLDDVDDLELLKTLVGHTGWFGLGSRVVVITKDKQLLKSHKIDLIYEVDFPSQDLALQMFCRCAFGQNTPPDGFMKLASEVANLSGNLPLGLNVLGSSLRGKDKEEWMELLPRLQNGLDGKIEKIIRVSYDELDGKDQEVFLYIACLLNGEKVDSIKNLLGESVNIALKMLADKSLIRVIPPRKTVQMHNLLQKLGKEIVRVESIYNPGKRRFLVDSKDICDVFTENTGSENVLGMYFNTSEIDEPLFINQQSFKRMPNLTFLKFYKEWSQKNGEGRLYLPQGFIYLPRKLRLLYWENYPLTSMRFNFRAEILIKLTMENSKLEKLWEGVQPLQSLKKIRLDGSTELKEIPNLSNATNLEKLNLFGCTSLVTLPSSFRNLNKLRKLSMEGCTMIEVLPTDINLGCLDYFNLGGCSRLRSFPRISRNISGLILDGTAIEEEDSFYLKNIFGLTKLDWNGCPMKCLPPDVRLENLVYLTMRGSKVEKLWEGIRSLGSLVRMDLSGCENLKEFPDLSMATNLDHLELNDCKSLVKLPSTIRNLNKLTRLEMQRCTNLKVLPTNVNLESLEYLDLRGCSSLRSFPRISRNISELHLNGTTIGEDKDIFFIGNISGITELVWIDCPIKYLPSNFRVEYIAELTMPGSKLEKLWEVIQTSSILYPYLDYATMRGCEKFATKSLKLKRNVEVDFSDCEVVTAFSDASAVTRTKDDQLRVTTKEASFHLGNLTVCEKKSESLSSTSHYFLNPMICLKFHSCFNLDRDAQKLILQSEFNYAYAVILGENVPTYFSHRATGNSLTISLPKSSLSQKVLRFKACIVLEPPTDHPEDCSAEIWVSWCCRGKSIIHHVYIDIESCKMDHLVVFHSEFCPSKEVVGHSYELDYNKVKFQFEYHSNGCSCIKFGPDRDTQTCDLSLERIKGCGVRLLDVSPSEDGRVTSSQTEYNQQSIESDIEWRSKKRMRMMVKTFEEPSNLLCGNIVANTSLPVSNLELSCGQVEASSQMSSTSTIPLSSVSSSKFHGDGTPFYHSLVPSEPCLTGEALYFDPLITEQQDKEMLFLDPRPSPQLITFLS